MSPSRPPLLSSLVLALLALLVPAACDRAQPGVADIGSAEVTEDAAPEPQDTTAPTPDTEDASPPEDTSAPEDTASDVEDTSEDTAPDVEDSTEDTAPDAEDTSEDTTEDTSPLCPAEAPCLLTGYVPPCYEGRCNPAGRCLPARIPNCCASDADCLPPLSAPACHTTRCVSRTCLTLPEPGCCADDSTCATGFFATLDRCLPTARCEHCPAPCERAPLLERRFDTPDPLTSLGFVVIDPQPADQVTWQRATARSAAGAGALYLGNPRCRTYYGGGLDGACAPTSSEHQDSQRVSPTLLAPFVSLPADTPAIASFMVFAQVEPALGRGDAEPDLLKVYVEPIGAPPWRVASTLELGKSTGWTPVVIDLAPWRGQPIRLRFEFDTLDGQNNHHEGVWLDELVIAPTCATGGCCESDEDCGETASCSSRRCLQTSQGSGRVCVDTPQAAGDTCTSCLADIQCDDGDPCTTDRCLNAGHHAGRCEHVAFCCLARDLLAADFDTTLAPLIAEATTPFRWYVRNGAATFGDPATGTYAGPTPARGVLSTPTLQLPERLGPRQRLTADLTLILSTEWDLAPPGAFDNPAALDRLALTVIDSQTSLATTLWTSDQIEGTTRGAASPLSLDLSPWRGRQVVLRLSFDSGDNASNQFTGPAIDHLQVRISCD